MRLFYAIENYVFMQTKMGPTNKRSAVVGIFVLLGLRIAYCNTIADGNGPMDVLM